MDGYEVDKRNGTSAEDTSGKVGLSPTGKEGSLAANSSAQLEQSHSDYQGVGSETRDEFHLSIFDGDNPKTIQPFTYVLITE